MSSMILANEAVASFPILPALVFLPMVGAAVLALIPRSRPEISRQVAILFALATGVLVDDWALHITRDVEQHAKDRDARGPFDKSVRRFHAARH